MTIKRAIAIGTLSAITITLIAFGIKTKSFKPKTTTPNTQHRSAIRVDADTTTLANTKWAINSNPSFSSGDVIMYDIKFISNNENFDSLYLNRDSGDEIAYINSTTNPFNWILVYDFYNSTWLSQEYRIIEITDGTDVTNANLIAWLEANAIPYDAPLPPTPTPDQTIEVVPIMPLMFKILTMPFTFISQAFNVTLWEGTPYEFNFSNFILSLISIATLLFIIKLFTSGFSIIGNYSANHESRALKRSQTKLNNAKTEQIKSGNKTKPSKKG